MHAVVPQIAVKIRPVLLCFFNRFHSAKHNLKGGNTDLIFVLLGVREISHFLGFFFCQNYSLKIWVLFGGHIRKFGPGLVLNLSSRVKFRLRSYAGLVTNFIAPTSAKEK